MEVLEAWGQMLNEDHNKNAPTIWISRALNVCIVPPKASSMGKYKFPHTILGFNSPWWAKPILQHLEHKVGSKLRPRLCGVMLRRPVEALSFVYQKKTPAYYENYIPVSQVEFRSLSLSGSAFVPFNLWCRKPEKLLCMNNMSSNCTLESRDTKQMLNLYRSQFILPKY